MAKNEEKPEVPTVSDSELVQIAVEICCIEEFKTKVLTAQYREICTEHEAKEKWDKNVILVAKNLLNKYEVEDDVDSVIGIVFSIALTMLTWTEYYIGTFGLTREFCVEFFEPSLFTPQGTIDYEKVGKKLTGNRLSNLTDFQLACYYCQAERIDKLYNALTDEEKKLVYGEKQPGNVRQQDLVKFWPYFHFGKLELLVNEESDSSSELRKVKDEVLPSEVTMIKIALKSAAKVAIEYFSKSNKDKCFAAQALVIERAILKYKTDSNRPGFLDDWVVFRQKKYDIRLEYWVPEQFYVDTFFSILSKLKLSDLENVAQTIFENIEKIDFGEKWRKKVLVNFLRWPYVEQFFELLRLSWNFLKDTDYAFILSEIVDRIAPVEGDYWYVGRSKFYNYREFLMKVWEKSPQPLKEKAISETLETDTNTKDTEPKTGHNFLTKLLNLRSLNEIDEKNISSILDSVSYAKKLEFLKFEEVVLACVKLLRGSEIDKKIVKTLISKCCQTDKMVTEFKKSLAFDRFACMDHIRNDGYEESEAALKWFEMSHNDFIDVKREIVKCNEGRKLCRELCMREPAKAEKYIEWAFQKAESENFSEIRNKIAEYKLSLLDQEGIEECEKALLQDLLEQVNQLISWCFSNENDGMEFKRNLISKQVRTACLSNFDYVYAERIMTDNPDASITQIVDWSKVDKLLKWCCPLEADLENYKVEMIGKEKDDIISKFIGSDKWAKADKFMKLLKMSSDEESEFKRKRLFRCASTVVEFHKLFSCNNADERFAKSQGKTFAIEKFLQFFLVDQEAVNEFKAKYNKYVNFDRVKSALQQIEQSFSKFET